MSIPLPNADDVNSKRDSKAITLGHPSYVWRFGQDRRLDLIRHHANIDGARILDVGCGLGTYVGKLRQFSDEVYGVDLDQDKVVQAQARFPNIYLAPAEELPFPDGYYDVVLLHEVLEHVADDHRSVAEAHRVVKVGGRLVVFVPNRLYPFETHGVFWKGEYHFGNVPLVNYLPNALRRRLCPHVRSYTSRSLLRLFEALPCRVVCLTQIYPGYDSIARRHAMIARLLRTLTYTLERTPLRLFGLSHLLVVEKTA